MAGVCHHGWMCGRFAVTTDPALLAEKINAIDERVALDIAQPNYNVAPTTTISTVVSRHDDVRDEPVRRLRSMRWGLVPPWVKAASDGTPDTKGPLLINARSEKVTTSPAYRSSARNKRCLVPMDGYYEWKAAHGSPGQGPERKKARKTPYYIYREDGQPMLMAGLWSAWGSTTGSDVLLSCTIVTTDAVGDLADVHDRMPLVLCPGDWDRWLDPDKPAPFDLLASAPDVTGIRMHEVSILVNNVRNNGPELIDRDAVRWGAAE